MIFQAGSSKTGKAFAAKHGEAIFTHAASLEQAQEFYRDVKQQAVQNGRKKEDIQILTALSPIMGATIEEAEERFSRFKTC